MGCRHTTWHRHRSKFIQEWGLSWIQTEQSFNIPIIKQHWAPNGAFPVSKQIRFISQCIRPYSLTRTRRQAQFFQNKSLGDLERLMEAVLVLHLLLVLVLLVVVVLLLLIIVVVLVGCYLFANVDDWTWKIQNLFREKSSNSAPKNANVKDWVWQIQQRQTRKSRNRQWQMRSQVKQTKLCEGNHSTICHICYTRSLGRAPTSSLHWKDGGHL